MVVRQPAQRRDVLADRIGPDHDLDAVVAQPRGQSRTPPPSSRGRPTPSTVRPRVGHLDGVSAHRHAHPVQPPQDHALAQRPRADLERVDVERPSPPRPRRAGEQLRCPARRDPGQLARSSADILASLGTQSRDAATAAAGARRARPRRRRAGQPRQLLERLRRTDHVRRSPSSVISGDAAAASCGAHVLAQPLDVAAASGGSPGRSRGSGGRAERQREGARPAPRSHQWRPRATRRRCRARAAARWTSRTSAEPRGR